MKKILTMSIVIVSLLSACSVAEEAALVESQILVDEQVGSDAPETAIVEEPENKENRNGERQFPGFDYETLAEELGVSAEDLAMALDENQTQGVIDFVSIAAQLGIEEDDLSAVFEGVDFGMGREQRNIPSGEIDYAAVAEVLNVSESDLRTALENNTDENGRINFEQAALQLGLNASELMGAIGRGEPGMGSPRMGGPGNNS